MLSHLTFETANISYDEKNKNNKFIDRETVGIFVLCSFAISETKIRDVESVDANRVERGRRDNKSRV